MKRMSLTLLPALGAAALTASPASAQVVFDDDFSDGNLAQTGALDTDWWTSSSSSGLEISPGVLGSVTGTSGRGFHTVFAPQTLDDPGDKVVATYTFTTPDTVGTDRSTAFRVGLFDSLGRAGLDANVSASSGTPNELYGWGPAFGNPNNPGTLTLPGFMFDMDVNLANDEDDLNFRSHNFNDLSGTGRLMATTSNFSNISPSGDDQADLFAPNTSYTGSFSIERISATEFELVGTLGGISHTVVTDVINSNTIDFLGFHTNSRTFGSTNSQGEPDNGLDFSNIKVEFMIPEPASLALVGLGGLALLRRRA